MPEKLIKWQKYEDVIEGQLKSPMLNLIANTYFDSHRGHDEDDDDEDEDDDMDEFGRHERIVMRLPDSVTSEISMVTNFDCWMAYTNFDITPSVKTVLEEEVEGVELLKVCGRYRFLIGVGKMFDFATVRKSIQEKIAS